MNKLPSTGHSRSNISLIMHLHTLPSKTGKSMNSQQSMKIPNQNDWRYKISGAHRDLEHIEG
jgi:hypothetical protein